MPTRQRIALLAGLAVLVVFPGVCAASVTTAKARLKLVTSRVDVPLDRTGVVPGTVRLNVQRVVTPGATSDAVLALAGGPGQSATSVGSELLGALGPALQRRDLILFDQRGTGRSGALRCPGLQQARTPSAAETQACAESLGPERAFYRTSDTVEDIEAVRQAAGVSKLIIYGASYGTKVALAYAQAHPDAVEKLVLDSVVPPEGEDPFEHSTLQAAPRVLRELCTGGACRGITPDPAADLQQLARLLGSGPLHGSVIDRRGHRHRTEIDQVGLFDLLLAGDLNPTLRADVPSAVTSALRGDNAPLMRLIFRAQGSGQQAEPTSSFSAGAFVATACEETTFPWAPTTPLADRAAAAQQAVDAQPDAAFGPFSRQVALSSQVLELCAGWPAATAPPGPVGALPNVPALVVSGRDDMRTPLEDAAAVAERLPAGESLPVPHTGHTALVNDPSGCARREIGQFVNGRLLAPCRSGRPLVKPSPVAPQVLKLLPAAPGMHGTPGRIVTAFALSVADAARQVAYAALSGDRSRVLGGGGLRGGTYRLTRAGLEMHNYVYLPTFKVNLTAGNGHPVKLHFFGVTHGTLVLTGKGRLTGTLSGQRVNTRITLPDFRALQRRATAAAAAVRIR